MNGWMCKWMGRWMDKWMDGWRRGLEEEGGVSIKMCVDFLVDLLNVC